jgi:GT2 family glycosyltransferase
MGVILSVLLDALLLGSLLGLETFLGNLRRIAQTAPILAKAPTPLMPAPLAVGSPQMAIIIPAYNEAVNIQACLQAVLVGLGDVPAVEVLVVDDQSTDGTGAIAQAWLQEQDCAIPSVRILSGQPRPEGSVWAGKNWACAQAVDQTAAAVLLFLDADVRLKPGAVGVALDLLQREQVDLLTVVPEIECGCLAEWLVQPLILSLLVAGFDFAEVNDPESETAFAAGPFMLFRRTAYEQIGGHRAVADEPVEDVELARRIKQAGLRLQYRIGKAVASARMYRSWGALWEGWTKNWHLGSRRNLGVTLYSVVIMGLTCTVPWLGGLGLLGEVLLTHTIGPLAGLGWAIALTAMVRHYRLRQAMEQIAGIPPRYWWLTGVGGIVVSAIALASLIKTETGWGWTWRGRSLTLPQKSR